MLQGKRATHPPESGTAISTTATGGPLDTSSTPARGTTVARGSGGYFTFFVATPPLVRDDAPTMLD